MMAITGYSAITNAEYQELQRQAAQSHQLREERDDAEQRAIKAAGRAFDAGRTADEARHSAVRAWESEERLRAQCLRLETQRDAARAKFANVQSYAASLAAERDAASNRAINAAARIDLLMADLAATSKALTNALAVAEERYRVIASVRAALDQATNVPPDPAPPESSQPMAEAAGPVRFDPSLLYRR